MRCTLERSFEGTLIIYWSVLKLQSEKVTSATNLVQESDLTYFASASPLSNKITSNASINGWNLEIIITYDSACMSQLTVHAFMECSMTYQRLKAFLFPTLGICSNNSLKTNTQGIKIFWLKMLCDDFTQVNSLFTKQTKLASVNVMPHLKICR